MRLKLPLVTALLKPIVKILLILIILGSIFDYTQWYKKYGAFSKDRTHSFLDYVMYESLHQKILKFENTQLIFLYQHRRNLLGKDTLTIYSKTHFSPDPMIHFKKGLILDQAYTFDYQRYAIQLKKQQMYDHYTLTIDITGNKNKKKFKHQFKLYPATAAQDLHNYIDQMNRAANRGRTVH